MPSELCVEVVEVYLQEHPNADSLSIVKVHDYQVITASVNWQDSDLGLYFPVDTIVPVDSRYSFLWKDSENPSLKQRTIKAAKLRGEVSMGLLIPLSEFPELGFVNVGDNVAEKLGVTKTSLVEIEPGENISGEPAWFSRYTNIENALKYHKLLQPGELVNVQEKIHGSNFRAMYKDDRLWIGSHRRLKANSVWNKVATKFQLEDKLQQYPNHIFYGEVYGAGVQKGYNYGLDEPSLIIFDIFNVQEQRYLNRDEFCTICCDVHLPIVVDSEVAEWTSLEDFQEKARGGSLECIVNLSEKGESAQLAHIKEGIVIKPYTERLTPKGQRVIVKLLNPDYLLRS